KEESIDTILQMSEYKDTGNCKYLIVAGCLVQRYEAELRKSLPEVDYFFNLKNFSNINYLLNSYVHIDIKKRYLLTPSHFAYLRISDGCNNCCSYCAIPKIRGRLRSKPIQELINEASQLVKNGVKELIIIAQDIGNYGLDLYEKSKLCELLSELDKIDNLSWIRLMYLHPKHISEKLLKLIAKSEKICNYLDIPIQHINDRILNLMNRKISKNEIIEKLNLIKEIIPEAALRTTLLVGFPGETKEEFKELLESVKTQRFSKLGCFSYSKEEGTKAAILNPQIPERIKKSRFNTILKYQQNISKKILEKYVGQKLNVIVDKKVEDSVFECRTEFDAPDIDGIVYLQDTDVNVGDIIEVEITDSLEYDLIAILT
ncbi:MAG: 30S ribosomal protein S12 methylthiotransferase RimO, partial [Candidatus Cloacimonetes bacterium]|nr:30S ribosomal protein S12 methylthiotransferase RimO [Candidatus Cloacimonadota bacterium]